MSNPFEVLEKKLDSIESLVLELKANSVKQNQAPGSEELLTVDEAAKFLSLRPQTLYSIMSRGNVPFMKKSKRCYFLKSELIEYMKSGRKKSISDIQREVESYDQKRKG